MTYHTLSIQTITRETPDTVSILFKIPKDLVGSYQFMSGQYVMVKATIDGQEVSRAYSISSYPHSKKLQITVKANDKGAFSVWVNEKLKVGDTLQVSEPQGSYFVLNTHKEQQNQYMGFATGSGITPIFSMLQEVLTQEPKSTFSLVYGNKNPESTIFKNQIDKWQQQFPNRLFVQYVYSKNFSEFDLNGHIDAQVVKHVLEESLEHTAWNKFYICGQEDFKENVAEALFEHGFTEDQVLYEMWSRPKRKPKV